ncbi:hypothetical protein BKA65DRAFT_23864 [Rhexocercosporidium sp. MPI-PUGE-AT-0058]|nr:hypothetical protein BKA65DRAFT_23864 [Rhexocercosporidium sp. MPI-PUGE-AT-0058]
MALNKKIVVNLISDDEDESRLQPVADRNNFLPTTATTPSTRPSLPVAFNGLPDPGEFPNRAIAQGKAGLPGMSSLGSPRHSSARPSQRVNGVNKRSAPDHPAAQPSVPYRDENTRVRISGSRATNTMNAGVKRRKLEEKPKPIPQIGRISSAPILPPTTSNNLGRKALTTPSRMSNGSQATTSAIAGKPTIITGALRAAASSPRVLSDGRLVESPSEMPSAMEPEMKRVLEQQVLPHVHAAVRPYRETLTHAERTEIGRYATSKLVTVPGFMVHYMKNDKTLTPAFESQIKLNAYLFVNQGVERVVKQRLQEEDRIPATRQTSALQDGTMDISRSVLKSSVETSENGSSPPSEEFEYPSLVQKRRRAISVSTSTSYSNDHTDAETRKHNAWDNTNQERGTDMSRSRRTAAILPQGAYQLKKRSRRSAAEMSLVRGADREDSEGHVGSSIQAAPSPAATRPVRLPPPVQQEVLVKPKRRRRTKLQMEEARRLEAQSLIPARTNSRPRTQNDSLGANNFQAPALARGNVARPFTQQPVAQSIQSLRPATISPDDDHLKLPYISSGMWKKLKRKLSNPEIVKLFSKAELDRLKTATLHVPFSSEELKLLYQTLVEQSRTGRAFDDDPAVQIVRIMKDNAALIPDILKALRYPKRGRQESELLRTRDAEAITDFLKDASRAAVNVAFKMSISFPQDKKSDHLMALLRDREVYGMSPQRSRLGQSSFKVVANRHLEDAVTRQSEWTDCSGDISSITWTGPDTFICGALAHSDTHNMQYNKPGNLLVGSTSLDVVKSYPDHRVIRPVVANEGEKENANALESMRTTQSPWLYESVVSTAHCENNGFSFTASFDKTVKVWSASDNGSGMTLRGTWLHHEKVNFVATSPHHDRIATATATNGNAVRVYSFDNDAISLSPYDEYCGDRSGEPTDEMGNHAQWSYQPATMQWGKSPGVLDFLLVGYSPRSITGNDSDVPELKKNTGEICLWNTTNKEQISIISAKSQNVFEVIWHPTQPIFLAATSPHGPCDSAKIRTQIRIFHQQDTGTFTNVKTLDCPAIDVNELTVKANSTVECFVTASCTDGFTYVWDTARGDQPLHALQHGETLDNPDPDVPLDVGDSGVKFAAWGRSSDRFYTGGSDGVVKAWNLKAASGEIFVRNIMSISGGISTGVFNQDCSKLLIGDATGKIYFLSIDDSDIKEDPKPAGPVCPPLFAVGSQLSRMIRRPKLVIPHLEPAPPAGYVVEAVEKTGVEIAQEYLASSQIIRVSEPYNFVYQGPNYLQTNLFRREAHFNDDISKPLVDEIWAVQQCVIKNHRTLPIHSRLPNTITSSNVLQHQKNIQINQNNFRSKTLFEWDPSKISPELWALLDYGRFLDLAEDISYNHFYEPTPRFGMFKVWKKYLDWERQNGDGTPAIAQGGFVEEEEDDTHVD